MKRFLIAGVAWLLASVAAHAAATANFPNINVRTNAQVGGTNFVKDTVVTNALTLQSATASRVLATDGAKGLVSVATTGPLNGDGTATTFNQSSNLLSMTPLGQAFVQAGPSTSLTFSNLYVGMLILTPTPWTQTTTNLVLDLNAGGWQTNTATADVHVTCSNIAAGRIVTLDIWAGTTNRNLTFDTPLTNWFSAVPSVISSNHIMRLSFMPPDDQTNHITLAAVQSFP